MRRHIPLALGLLVVASPGLASASRVLQKDGANVGWSSGTQLSFELVESFPAYLPPSTVRTQILQAMELWNDQAGCSAPPLSVSGAAAALPSSGDNRNTVAWIYTDWAGTTGATPSAPGVTDIRISQDEQGQYRIIEADVYLNAQNFQWTTDPATIALAASQQTQYVKEVVAHELGHALGLDHTCEYDAPPDIPDCASGLYSSALMFPNPQYVEPTVKADDAAGLCGLYQGQGVCAEGDAWCNGSVDYGGSPLPIGPGGKCKKHAECASFLACLNGTCSIGTAVPGDTCQVHAECANGACINGGCRANCSVQEPCPYANQQCDTETDTCGNKLRVFGNKCTKADDCTSAQCIVDSNEGNYCTRECRNDSGCPSGWQCSGMNGTYVCVQPQASHEGCSVVVSPRGNGWSSATAMLFGIGLLGFAIRRYQRVGEN